MLSLYNGKTSFESKARGNLKKCSLELFAIVFVGVLNKNELLRKLFSLSLKPEGQANKNQMANFSYCKAE